MQLRSICAAHVYVARNQPCINLCLAKVELDLIRDAYTLSLLHSEELRSQLASDVNLEIPFLNFKRRQNMSTYSNI
jgi:hypothetical protein